MSKLVELKPYVESELALAVEAEGWMRQDLPAAVERGFIALGYSGEEPLVVVLPGKSDAFEAYLVERAGFWTKRRAELKAEVDEALAELKSIPRDELASPPIDPEEE